MADLNYCDLYAAIAACKTGYYFDYDLSDDATDPTPPTQLPDFGGFGSIVTTGITIPSSPGPYFWANDPEQPVEDGFLWCGSQGKDLIARTYRFGFSVYTQIPTNPSNVILFFQFANPTSWPAGGNTLFRSLDGLNIAGIHNSTSSLPLETCGRFALDSFYAATTTCAEYAPPTGWGHVILGKVGPSVSGKTSGFCTGLLEMTLPGQMNLVLAIQDSTESLIVPATFPVGLETLDTSTRTRGSVPSWEAVVTVNGGMPIQLPASNDPLTLATAIRWWRHGNLNGGSPLFLAPVTKCPGDTQPTNYLDGNYEVEITYQVTIQNLAAVDQQFALLAIPQRAYDGNTETQENAYLNLYDHTYNRQSIPLNAAISDGTLGAGWYDDDNAYMRQCISVEQFDLPACTVGSIDFTLSVENNSQGYYILAIVPLVPSACPESGVVPGCLSSSTTSLSYTSTETSYTSASSSTGSTTGSSTNSSSSTTVSTATSSSSTVSTATSITSTSGSSTSTSSTSTSSSTTNSSTTSTTSSSHTSSSTASTSHTKGTLTTLTASASTITPARS